MGGYEREGGDVLVYRSEHRLDEVDWSVALFSTPSAVSTTIIKLLTCSFPNYRGRISKDSRSTDDTKNAHLPRWMRDIRSDRTHSIVPATNILTADRIRSFLLPNRISLDPSCTNKLKTYQILSIDMNVTEMNDFESLPSSTLPHLAFCPIREFERFESDRVLDDFRERT